MFDGRLDSLLEHCIINLFVGEVPTKENGDDRSNQARQVGQDMKPAGRGLVTILEARLQEELTRYLQDDPWWYETCSCSHFFQIHVI